MITQLRAALRVLFVGGLISFRGLEACREIVAGATIGDVGGLLSREVLVGGVYAVLGLAALRFVEDQSRRRATLEPQ